MNKSFSVQFCIAWVWNLVIRELQQSAVKFTTIKSLRFAAVSILRNREVHFSISVCRIFKSQRKDQDYAGRTILSIIVLLCVAVMILLFILYYLKVKNDHRSKFSNLSNWLEEAWKNQGFNGIRTRDLREYRCDALPTELWSHTLGAMSINWVHVELRSRRSRVRIPLKPWCFQASSFQLLKLENLLRWSFFTFIYNRSSNMNYFIYTSHYKEHLGNTNKT